MQVTIRYDSEAKVHVSARELKSGKEASTEILRSVGAINQLEANIPEEENVGVQEVENPETVLRKPKPAPEKKPPMVKHIPPPGGNQKKAAAPGREKLNRASKPIPLCNKCGEPLDSKATCPACGTVALSGEERERRKRILQQKKAQQAQGRSTTQKPPRPVSGAPVRPPKVVPSLQDDDILELDDASLELDSAAPRKKKVQNQGPAPRPVPRPAAPQPQPKRKSEHSTKDEQSGEDDFWSLTDDF